MTDKQLHYIEGVGWRYDCDHSMTHRMKCHDYKTRSIYMLTITLADRSHPLLGTLRWKQKGETNVGKADETATNKAKEANASNVGETKATVKEGTKLPSPLDREAVVDLTPLGKRVRDCWEQIPVHYPDVRTIILQIMPDHLHGVLFVTQDQEAHLGQMVKGFKIGCSKAWWALTPPFFSMPLKMPPRALRRPARLCRSPLFPLRPPYRPCHPLRSVRRIIIRRAQQTTLPTLFIAARERKVLRSLPPVTTTPCSWVKDNWRI